MAAACDAGLRSAMVGLEGMVALLGTWIWSFNKALSTNAFGVVAVAGVALPDWEVFDRGFLEWTSPSPWNPRQDSESIRISKVSDISLESWFPLCRLRLWVLPVVEMHD